MSWMSIGENERDVVSSAGQGTANIEGWGTPLLAAGGPSKHSADTPLNIQTSLLQLVASTTAHTTL